MTVARGRHLCRHLSASKTLYLLAQGRLSRDLLAMKMKFTFSGMQLHDIYKHDHECDSFAQFFARRTGNPSRLSQPVIAQALDA